METAERFTGLELSLIFLTLITGLIHIYAGFNFSYRLLTLAGLGYLAGIVLFILNRYREFLVLASMPYTGAQIVIYYQMYGFTGGPTAVVDKITQLILLSASTVYLYRAQKT